MAKGHPTKAKVKAVAAKAEPAIRKQKCKEERESKAVVVSASVVPDAGTKVKRKQLARRDSDEQVDRYIAREFPHVSEARLLTVRSDDGKSLQAFVKEELKRRRSTKAGTTAPSHAGFMKTSNFIRTCSRVCPSRVSERNQKLEAAIEEIKSFWARCGNLDEIDMYALLNSVVPGPMLGWKESTQLQVAVLDFIARTSSHEQFSRYWEIVKDQFDHSLKEFYEAQIKEGVKRSTFLRMRRDTMALYVGAPVVDH